MKKNVWMRLMMAVLVAGLMLTVSCAQKTVVSEPTTVEDQDAAAAEAARLAEEERIKAQELEEKMALEAAAKVEAAKNRFFNQNIHFEFDSAQLSAMARTLLQEKADWLKANPSVAVTIEGHCDSRGTTVYNLALGERRALAVQNYLVDLGISASRLSKISYGEEKPLDSREAEEAYRVNRRAQFVLN